MDIEGFRKIVDASAPGITSCEGDLCRLYDYVGLQHGEHYSLTAVGDALYAQIRDCFTSGHAAVWQICKSLRKDLIRYHIIYDVPLDPYFEVIDHLQDAVRVSGDPQAAIEGDWGRAINCVLDHIQIQSWGTLIREKVHARDFMVAKSARFLRDEGFSIRLESGQLSIEHTAEAALVSEIEELVAAIGGINVARRIFKDISSQYDTDLQRYHVVVQTSPTGEGVPKIPWGYLLQIAVKHASKRTASGNNDTQWKRLCVLSMTFASVIDVQPYVPTYYIKEDGHSIVRHLQEMALFDTLFRIPQIRPKDVVKIARGMFSFLDTAAPTKAGWSIDHVLEIISYLLDPIRDVRGPISIGEADIRRACPNISSEIVKQILGEVLSHPPTGANQKFSRPTDAPIIENTDLKSSGYDFFLRPLLYQSGSRFWLLDQSVCAPACLEALLTPLRQNIKGIDEKVGLAVEGFLKSEFMAHSVPVSWGDYDSGGEHGQCDLVIGTPETVIFGEVKKKQLTRRAKAGSDAHLLIDFAGSLLAAQAQAGWHEVRLRSQQYLDLQSDGASIRIALNYRSVERIAISLFDFGSFQDRMLTKQFLESTMNVSFKPLDASLSSKFDDLNESLMEIRQQVALLYPGQKEIRQPFFNCWFISIPQILVLLDGITDADSFREALWSCRHIVTGSSDLYSDLSKMRQLKLQAASNGNK